LQHREEKGSGAFSERPTYPLFLKGDLQEKRERLMGNYGSDDSGTMKGN
jgi:hypothetical protein